mmetsp:Transcript_44820/g.48511  ORF Transcript_44820/g.48511 Transcript_44820/m.48511 type:complete len:490 (-) Transcript_44820:2289-3758(-)
MRNNVDDEQVEYMATVFEEQLSTVYPRQTKFPNGNNGYDDDNEKMKNNEERYSFQNLIHDLDYPTDYKYLKVAFTIAVQRLKIKNSNDQMTQGVAPSTNTTKNTILTGGSFSLLDHLQGGFSLPMTLGEIQEASSVEERIKLFEKIVYVDDLLMDWKEICHFLTTDLSDSYQVDPQLALQIINLHRKWFDQGRSSDEYTPLLFNICQNVLQILGKILKIEEHETQKSQHNGETRFSYENSDETLIISLVQNWRDMWLDLMQRNQYSEDLAQDMESCMSVIFLRTARSKKTELAQKVLAMVDPNARWFQSWTNHVTTHNYLISLLCKKERIVMILSELWIRIQTFREDDKNPPDCAVQLHSISIFSIILCRTRVSQFPWDLINQEITTQNVTTLIDEILDLFLRVVVFLSMSNSNNTAVNKNCSDGLKMTIFDGVEAILEGSRSSDRVDSERRFCKVRSILQQQDVTGDKIITGFLNTCRKKNTCRYGNF